MNLRNFSARSTERNVCICIAMARKNSLFFREYYNHIVSLTPDDERVLAYFFTTVLKDFVTNTSKVSMKCVLLNCTLRVLYCIVT